MSFLRRSPALLLIAVILVAAGCSDRGSELATAPSAPISPSIDAIAPDSGAVGDTVRIFGSRFGGTQGSSTVEFPGSPPPTMVNAPVASWSDTLIVAMVPTGAISGAVRVRVDGAATNGAGFSVHGAPAPPVLTGLVPDRTVVGDTVRVAGANLGPTQGTRVVLFTASGGGVDTALALTWQDTQVTVLVPPGASDGAVIIVVNGTSSNGLLFSVAPARVTYAVIDGLIQSWGCYGCHTGGGSFVGNFDTSSWATVMLGTSDHGPAVIPRRGNESMLVKKMRGTAGFGERMPQGSAPLTPADIQKFVDWINQGAREN